MMMIMMMMINLLPVPASRDDSRLSLLNAWLSVVVQVVAFFTSYRPLQLCDYLYAPTCRLPVVGYLLSFTFGEKRKTQERTTTEAGHECTQQAQSGWRWQREMFLRRAAGDTRARNFSFDVTNWLGRIHLHTCMCTCTWHTRQSGCNLLTSA